MTYYGANPCCQLNFKRTIVKATLTWLSEKWIGGGVAIFSKKRRGDWYTDDGEEDDDVSSILDSFMVLSHGYLGRQLQVSRELN